MSSVIGEAISAGATLIDDLVQRAWPDKSKEEQAKLSAEAASEAQQNAINLADAQKPGMHPREGAMWMCVAAMCSNFVIRPFAIWGTGIAGHPVDFPQLDTTVLAQMLFALLGLGYMHMNENIKSK